MWLRGRDDVDILGAKHRGQSLGIAPDGPGILAAHGQAHEFTAERGQFAFQPSAFAGDQSPAAGSDNCLRHFQRGAFSTTGFELGNDLENIHGVAALPDFSTHGQGLVFP